MQPIHGVYALVLLAFTACGREAEPTQSPERSGPDWESVGESELDRSQLAQAEAAKAARDQLGSTLVGELTAAMQAGGPERAITVCQERAPAIAAEVSRAKGLRIGRTSVRLRNPSNSAPAWAASTVASGAKDPAWFEGPERELGALFPIRLQAQCVVCHGATEQLGSGVPAALAERYPEDRATGFEPGDLRGWFWVEVPAGE